MAVDYFANPPPGLDLSESRTASNNAVGIVLFVLSLIFVALRLLTRLRLKHEVLGLDDYLMILGLGLNAGNLACCLAGEHHYLHPIKSRAIQLTTTTGGYYGLGKHIWTLSPYEMRKITIVQRILQHTRSCTVLTHPYRSHSPTSSSTPGASA